MKIAIHTLGTRGDIQPYLALALGLKAAGHDVLMAAPSQFEAMIGTRGIGFAHLPREYLDLLDSPEGKSAMTGAEGFAGGFKLMKYFKPIARKQLSEEWAAAREFNPDLIIYHPKAVAAPHIAEKLSCASVLASPLPGFTPTTAFASPLMPWRSLGPLNRLSHTVMAGSADTLFRGLVGEWRVSELKLERRPSHPLPPRATLYAYSEHVLPVPADWPQNVAVTGYWVLRDDSGWQPDEALQRFLSAGDPPVYVGFGSMPGVDPAALTEAIVDSLAQARCRGVLATGGGALGASARPAGHVHFIEGAPHEALFPLMSACVHHGGAGTTGASLRAGKPTLICPFFGDQPFWARRVEELGVGPAPRPIRQLSTEWLSAAIEQATNDAGMRRRAEALGGKIRNEDGVANAIAFLDRMDLLRKPAAQ